jgi:hypothetical protein
MKKLVEKTVILLYILPLLLIFSCRSGSAPKNLAMMETADASRQLVVSPPAQSSEPESNIDRKIIKEGNLLFETKDIKATTALIRKNTEELKGYVAQENGWASDNRISQTLELRVPAENFDLLLSRITENVENIESKNINLQDVTEEFIDVEARLKTKKELESRYLELLKKAVKVEEILSIEKEIGTLRADIESIEGRLKYLNERVSLSKLTVNYYQKIKSPFQFSSKFGDSVKGGWRNLLWFFIGLTNLWPFIVIGAITLIIVLVVKKRKKLKNN